MKRLILTIGAAVLIATGCFAQDAKQDMKTAGQDTKDAAKNTGKAVKHTAKTTGRKVKHGTKHVVNKGAQATEKGAAKVDSKTSH